MDALGKNPARMVPEVVPPTELHWPGSSPRTSRGATGGFCQFQTGFQPEFGLAAIALADAGPRYRRRPTRKEDKDKAGQEAEPKDELPEEFLGQMIKEVVMHEVGHSLGLRHNFKASTMLTADQINDTAITRVKGLVGSVMDYNPINIAPKGQKQGDLHHDDDRPLRLLGDRIRLQADRRATRRPS